MIHVEEARRRIAAHVGPVAAEATPLLAALGRVLASPVVAGGALPPFDACALDGYAVRAADVAGAAGMGLVLPLAGAVAAGAAVVPALPPHQALRVAAGAPLPAGADAVVPLALADEAEGWVSLPTGARAGAGVRRAGEDVARGATVLPAGRTLTAARIALLASLGRETAIVFAPLRVGILSIGDELAEPGGFLRPGQVYDANGLALMAAVAEAGGHPLRACATGDDREEVRRALGRGLGCDVVITTGGLGEGAHDHLADVLADIGRVHVKGVAQSPGEGFMFATVRGTPVFALPGDPVAAAVCFELYLRPALRLMMGHEAQDRPCVRAMALDEHVRRPGRTAFLRARVRKAGATYHAALLDGAADPRLGAVAEANALVIVPPEAKGFARGELVQAMLLEAPELCGMACEPVGLGGRVAAGAEG